MLSQVQSARRVRVSNAVAAGLTTITTAAVDLGADVSNPASVALTVALGTVTAGAVITVQGQSSPDNSTWTNITGGSVAVTDVGGASSNKLLTLDLVRVAQRYIRATITRGTANAAVDSVVANCYDAGRSPVAGDASEAAAALVVCPN